MLKKLATGTYLDVFNFEGAEQSELHFTKIRAFIDYNFV